MQHIRHTRQVPSRLRSPGRCRLSIARAPDGERWVPWQSGGCLPAPGEGSSGGTTRSPALAPGGCPLGRSSSHRTTSYARCPRRGHQSLLLAGIAANLANGRFAGCFASPGAPSSAPAQSSPSRGADGRRSCSRSSQRGRAERPEGSAERGAAPGGRKPAGWGCGRRLAPRSRALPRWQALGSFFLVVFSS